MDKKQIPKELKNGTKRQEVQNRLIARHGSLGQALEAITGAEFPKCANAAKKDSGNCNGFRRWVTQSGDFFEESGSIVDVRDGPPAKQGNFFGMLAAYYGYCGFSQHEEGFEIALSYLIDNGIEVKLSSAEQRKLDEKRAARLAKEAFKAEKAKKSGIAVYSRKLPVEDAHALYEMYIRGGRKISYFSANGLSQHVCAVKDLPYFCEDDDKNNGKKFDAMLFPYGKHIDGKFNIYGLHAIYLDRKGGVVGKADVDLAKQDLKSWSSERGVACDLTRRRSRHLIIGEGNETVSAFFAAFETCEDYSGQYDYKFTNTASRLKNADVGDYDSVNFLVDRDKSGTGMKMCMEQQYKLEGSEKVVNLIIPPSSKVPIYIYPHKHSVALSVERCIKQCEYWRRVDTALAIEAKAQGVAYVPRYEAYIVLDKSFGEDESIDYEHVIRESEIPKNVPKGVDWDNVLQHGPQYAFELFDLSERIQSRNVA